MKNIIKGLSQYINSMKIKNQLLLAYLIAGIIPIVVIGIYLVSNTRNLVLQQQISDAMSENKRVEGSLTQLADIVYDVSANFNYDSDLRKIISTKYNNVIDSVNASQGYDRFSTYLQDYSDIKNIIVYTENKTIYNSTHYVRITPEIRKMSWFKRISNNWNVIWDITTDKSDGKKYLSLIRQMGTESNQKAYIVVTINTENLNSIITQDRAVKTVAAVYYGGIFLSSDGDSIGDMIKYGIPHGSKHKEIEITYKNHRVVAVLDDLGSISARAEFYILTVNYEALKKADQVTQICCIVLLLSIVVPFLLILYFSNVFSKRINVLRKEMSRAASGELEIPSNPGGNDEISELYNDLNLMIDGIKNLLNEVYMEKLIKERMINSQQKIEFKMLASQINPHFLYNTLETIRMKLICNGDRETANVIKILGKTIRRMLEVKDEVVTLDSELEYIRYYLEIQQFRFGSRIEYEIDIDPKINIKKIYLLPLLLQPIVENAFVHGLEDKTGGGKITVEIRKSGDILIISVEDNGVGISKEKCDFLNSAICDMKSGGSGNNINGSIGLCNVHQRIVLFYGQSYGIKISSRLNFGTKVLISLPLDGEVISEYESNNHRR